MADADNAPPPPPPPSPPEPEAMRPRRGSSTAVIVRESDRMRIGIDAAVLDVSTGLLSLSTTGAFAVDEQVKIRLKNVIQRFEKEARGLVRLAEADQEGSTRLSIELLTRLSALEVSLVKMGIPPAGAGPVSRWV